MWNVPGRFFTQAHTSEVDLAKVMIDPERVMRNPTNPYVLTTFRRQGQTVLEQINTLDDVLRSEDEGPPSVPEHGTTPAPNFLSLFLNHLKLRA